ncbi:MAG: lytic transglycosylase domain-containing protein [Acidobacteria bacterium]|nr:lytic transglycosylase domain-containing protein [Acidobacteriota bacterium]
MLNKTLVIIFSLFAVASTAQAQSKSAKAKAAAGQAAVVETAAGTDDPARFRRDFIKASEEYRDSLKALAASQEKGLKRLEEQHEKLKGLYADGIIARREFEASDASVTEARAKFADVGQELARAETVIEAALKPPAPIAAPGGMEVASAATVVRKWTTGNRSLDEMIRYYGGKHGVDPYLIYCVMHQESRFGSTATSYKGAQGLMQLMPGTAARYGVTNSYDPAQNIQAGTRYLRDLLRLFNGRVDLALAGYNAGEGAVMKYGNRIPPYRETQNYVRTIGTRYAGGSGLVPVIKPVAPKSQGKGK